MVLPCLHGSHRRCSQHNPNMPPIFVNNSYGVSKLGVQRENFSAESCSKSLAQWNAKVSTGMFFLTLGICWAIYWPIWGSNMTNFGNFKHSRKKLHSKTQTYPSKNQNVEVLKKKLTSLGKIWSLQKWRKTCSSHSQCLTNTVTQRHLHTLHAASPCL